MSEMQRKRTYEWNDPFEGANKAGALPGIEYLEAMNKDEIPLPPIVHTPGFGKPDIKQGEVTFYFEPQEYHYNPIGSVHGGVITSILDSAMGCTLQSVLPAGTGYTTLELKVNFLKAVSYKNGKMTAVGKIIHAGKSTALVKATLTDASGKVYAYGIPTCMILIF